MIDKEKWNSLNDKEKLETCKLVGVSITINSVTKADWKLMFDFLLSKAVQDK